MDNDKIFRILQGLGTIYAAPYRSPEQIAVGTTRPTYAEITADQIIADWQSSGEVKIETLRGLIIKALEEYDD